MRNTTAGGEAGTFNTTQSSCPVTSSLYSKNAGVWQRLHLLLDNDVPGLMRFFGEKVGIQLKNCLGFCGDFFLEDANLGL